MSEENPLHRAHALSAEASVLLRPIQVSRPNLQRALSSYQQAAQLFEQSSASATDDGAKRTLQLLTNQHKKLARDLERRIATADSSPRPIPSVPGLSRDGVSTNGRVSIDRRATSPVVGTGTGRREDGSTLGLGGIGRGAWLPPGVATRLSPSRGVPPFSLRPPSDPNPVPASTPRPIIDPSPSSPSRLLNPIPIESPSFSTNLHSSSSSSDATEFAESYVHFGGNPDLQNASDPFNRFWGMLENMLDEVSNPVKFASAPLDVSGGGVHDDGNVERVPRNKTKNDLQKMNLNGKNRNTNRSRSPSPAESFYVISKKSSTTSVEGEASNAAPAAKTPEELQLENENLRASLDAIALHAQTLEKANKALKEQAEEREKLMKSVVVGVRREAQKAKHTQEMLHSQLLASVSASTTLPPNRAVRNGPGQSGDDGVVAGLRTRIRKLEEEVRTLKEDNEKQRTTITKYKERWDKLKTNAKNKRESKSNNVTGQEEKGNRSIDQ